MKFLGTHYLIQIQLDNPQSVDAWYETLNGHEIICRLSTAACIFPETQEVYSTYKFSVVPGQIYPAGYLISLEHCKVLKHHPAPGF